MIFFKLDNLFHFLVLLFLQETYISLTNQIQGPCLKLWIKVFSVGYMV